MATHDPYKSEGERQLARLFDRNRIRYQYEYPLALMDKDQVRLWYPDFRLPDYGLIVEYFGVNGNREYDRLARHKIEIYQRNGIEGLFLTKESLQGNWPEKIIGQIQDQLEQHLDRFCHRSDRKSSQ